MKLLEVKYISPSSSSGANLYIRVELLNGIQWSWFQSHSGQLKESCSGKYHMHHQFIPIHSCDYLNKTLIKINVSIDKGTSRNEI